MPATRRVHPVRTAALVEEVKARTWLLFYTGIVATIAAAWIAGYVTVGIV